MITISSERLAIMLIAAWALFVVALWHVWRVVELECVVEKRKRECLALTLALVAFAEELEEANLARATPPQSGADRD